MVGRFWYEEASSPAWTQCPKSSVKRHSKLILSFVIGSQPQKGIVTYTLSPNRYDPLAGIVKNAVFNTYRRTKHQILYWLPPLVLAYFLMDWAVEQLVADLEEEYHLWELRD